MKARRLFFTLVVVFLVSVAAFVGCDKGCNRECKHEYSGWKTVTAATCTENGTQERTCKKCSEKDTQTIPATGHTYGSWKAEVAATCETAGVKGHYECSACHKYFDKDKNQLNDLTISAGHNYGEWVTEVAATCETAGVKGHYECSACHKYFDKDKNQLNDLTISAGHDYGEWVTEVPATCETAGVKGHYECSACHKYFDTDKNQLNDLTISAGHNYGEWVTEVAATCETAGVKGHYECSTCHKYFDAGKNQLNDLTIKPHTLIFVEGQPATCTESGRKDAYRCTICRRLFDENGDAVTDLVIPAKGHTYTDMISEVPATETENGVKAHKDCTDCGLHFDADGNELDDLVIPASAHVFGEWIEEVPATCDTDGAKGHYECSHCNKNFDKEYKVLDSITIKAAHDPEFYPEVAPTCKKAGNVAFYRCKKCGEFFNENMETLGTVEIAKLAHTFGEWVEEVPATCDTDGVKAHKTCTVCHDYFDTDGNLIKDIIIDAAHKFTLHEGTAATCTTSGTLAYNSCSACNKNFDVFGKELADLGELTIPAKGHNFGAWVNGFAATCTEAGIAGHYHCSRCGKDFDKNEQEITSVILNATSHSYTTETIIEEVPATCVTDGTVAHFECSACGKFLDENGTVIENTVINKTGHTYGETYVGVSPTCTESGREFANICSVCGGYFWDSNNMTTLTEEDLYLPAHGHDYTNHEKKTEATCEEDGLEENYYCFMCDSFFDANKNETTWDALKIPKTGHKMGEFITGKPATETEDGIEDHYECLNCHEYFDADGYNLATIVIPKTSHIFTAWVYEVPATCDTDGTKGYYECSHCEKKFDNDYQEIEDLTIPASHKFGDLVEARQGTCNEQDILISHYRCSRCGKYFDKDGNQIDSEIFVYGDHHEYEAKNDGSWWDHLLKCKVCGQTNRREHTAGYKYYVNDEGENVKKYFCSVCGFEADYEEGYDPVSDVEVIHPVYVGYSARVFRVYFEDGHRYNEWYCSDVFEGAELERYNTLVASLEGKNFEPFSRKFTASINDFTKEIEITFRPYVLYGVITETAVYQQGYINGLDQIGVLYDSNCYRETGETMTEYLNSANVVDDGGFDVDFDFAAFGGNTKTFTIKYKDWTDKVYEVLVTLTTEKTPVGFYANEYKIIQNGKFIFYVTYSDNTSEPTEFTEDMLAEGSFDPSVTGIQTFTINVFGLTKVFTIEVCPPDEVKYFYIESPQIYIGESLEITAYFLNGDRRNVVVTQEMIKGNFDNTVAGNYEIAITYGGVTQRYSIQVIDPSDTRVEYIGICASRYTLIWDVKNGEVVKDIRYLYIIVERKNGQRDFVKVTEDMISYDPEEARNAITEGTSFKLTISYYGASLSVSVNPAALSELEENDFRIRKTSDLDRSNYSQLYIQDGDLSEYFAEIITNSGVYFLPLTSDMFYIAKAVDGNRTLVPFDFENYPSAKYDLVVIRGDNEYSFEAFVYTEAEAEYSFYINTNKNIVAGTKEKVLAQLSGTEVSMYIHVCNYSSWFKYIDFDDLVIAPNDNVDFSAQGYVSFTASYNGIVFELEVMLIPDMEGVESKTYNVISTVGGYTLTLYENGYAYLDGSSSWATWSVLNESLNLYQIHFDYADFFFVIDGNQATIINAETLLGENLEEYTLKTAFGEYAVKIYTKNGFSMADIYDGDGDYDRSALVTFSADGKYIEFENCVYTIDGNVIVFAPQGNTVYVAYVTEDSDSMKVIFNDNGKAYIYRVVELSDGKTEEFILPEPFEWRTIGSKIQILYEGKVVVEGRLSGNEVIIEPSKIR